MTEPPLDYDDLVLGAVRDALDADGVITQLATSGVWQSDADQDTVPPYVLVVGASTEDSYHYRGLAWTRMMIEVRAVVAHAGGNVPASVSRLAAAIRRVLGDDAALTADGVEITMQGRVGRVEATEYPDGVAHHHRGGLYRIDYSPTA